MAHGDDCLPWRATLHSAPYEGIRPLPVCVLLENVRSLYNVGAFFRTCDAAGIGKLHLCGITGRPPKRAIAKTALGAEETVPWEHAWDALPALQSIRAAGRSPNARCARASNSRPSGVVASAGLAPAT